METLIPSLHTLNLTILMSSDIQTRYVSYVTRCFVINLKLRNHMSNHHKELFRCLKCGNLSRTEVSFNQHLKTHNGERFTCSVCLMVFDRKSTLTNHEQKHSTDKLAYKKCGKLFQYRGGFLEHIKYRHTASPTVPCPICKKLFWMPTGMRSHRRKIHGHVHEIVYKQ